MLPTFGADVRGEDGGEGKDWVLTTTSFLRPVAWPTMVSSSSSLSSKYALYDDGASAASSKNQVSSTACPISWSCQPCSRSGVQKDERIRLHMLTDEIRSWWSIHLFMYSLELMDVFCSRAWLKLLGVNSGISLSSSKYSLMPTDSAPVSSRNTVNSWGGSFKGFGSRSHVAVADVRMIKLEGG